MFARPPSASPAGGIVSARIRMGVRAESSPMRVFVTGAGGRTGSLVMQKLAARPAEFAPTGLVRSEDSAAKLAQKCPGVKPEMLKIGDALTDPDKLEPLMAGHQALVILTSAVPKIHFLSLFKVFWGKLTGKPTMPDFYFQQTPEEADWKGQRNQIRAAKKAGISRVVLVGSMGGTQPENRLNSLGDGNILVWKRKAEMLLCASGLNYTILHPGGLVDKPGGLRELTLDVDDSMVSPTAPPANRTVPRADVASVVVESLLTKDAENRSVDLASLPEGSGQVTKNIAQLFRDMKRNCNYALNAPPASSVAELLADL